MKNTPDPPPAPHPRLTLHATQCIVIGPVCGGVFVDVFVVGGFRTLLQPARAQCLRLSERFFSFELVLSFSSGQFRLLLHVLIHELNSFIIDTNC